MPLEFLLLLASLAILGLLGFIFFERSSWRHAALNNKKQFVDDVFNNTITQICLLDGNGYFTDANLKWTKFSAAVYKNNLSAPKRNLVAFFELLTQGDPETIPLIIEGINALVRGEGTDFCSQYSMMLDGVPRRMELRIQRLPGREDSMMLFQSDRTQHWLDEKRLLVAKREADALATKLERNQHSLELAIQGGRIGLWHWEVKAGYFELSQAWSKLLGCPDFGATSSIEAFRTLLHPDDQKKWTSEWITEHLDESACDFEFRLRCQSGAYTWVQMLGSVSRRNVYRKTESLSGVLVDINDRKNAEMRDLGMAKILEDSLNEIYVIDVETLAFIEVNRGARRNLGYTREELQHMTAVDTSRKTKEQIFECVALLVSGESDRVEFESISYRKDGSAYPIMLTIQKSELNGRSVFVSIGVDITKRSELENQLRQSQRLESIGQLAAGIAHEINTPLQCVGLNVKFLSQTTSRLLKTLDLVKNQLGEIQTVEEAKSTRSTLSTLLEQPDIRTACEDMPQAIDDSCEAVQSVLKIIKAMKEIAHPGRQEMVLTDLNHVIENTVAVTQNHWRNHAQLELELAHELPGVECDPGGMNQVFVNLLVNASDAVANRVKEEPAFGRGTITIRSRSEGRWVVIEIEDTGCGMNPRIAQRVFDPFFTTKGIGEGTGQGLTLCHKIITEVHGGQLTLMSEPERGTLFRIRLAKCEVEVPSLMNEGLPSRENSPVVVPPIVTPVTALPHISPCLT